MPSCLHIYAHLNRSLYSVMRVYNVILASECKIFPLVVFSVTWSFYITVLTNVHCTATYNLVNLVIAALIQLMHILFRYVRIFHCTIINIYKQYSHKLILTRIHVKAQFTIQSRRGLVIGGLWVPYTVPCLGRCHDQCPTLLNNMQGTVCW